MKRIDCFIPFVNAEQAGQTIANLKAEGLVNNIFLLAGENAEAAIEGCYVLKVKNLTCSETMRVIAGHVQSDYAMLYTKHDTLKFAPFAVERFVKLADDSGAGMLYADH